MQRTPKLQIELQYTKFHVELSSTTDDKAATLAR
jgi:hypothetical protein